MGWLRDGDAGAKSAIDSQRMSPGRVPSRTRGKRVARGWVDLGGDRHDAPLLSAQSRERSDVRSARRPAGRGRPALSAPFEQSACELPNTGRVSRIK